MDVWFREDVARVVRAARVASHEAQDCEVVGVVSRETAAYWRGYQAALATIGAAFGLACEDPRVIEMQSQPVLPVAHRPGRDGR
jgi:hypothetical protein